MVKHAQSRLIITHFYCNCHYFTFCWWFFLGGKLFRFSTKLNPFVPNTPHQGVEKVCIENQWVKQKWVSASVFNCKKSRQALSHSFTSSDIGVLRFPFLSCFGVIVMVLYLQSLIMSSWLNELFTGLWNNWMAWRRHLQLKAKNMRTWWRGNTKYHLLTLLVKFVLHN